MPHVIIEYSANVAEHHDIDALVSAVHRAALQHEIVPADALRTRATPCAAYAVADEHPANAFVAITARVGPGRDAADKRSLVDAILDAADQHLGETPLAIAWSVELTEIDPEFRVNRNHVRARMKETRK